MYSQQQSTKTGFTSASHALLAGALLLVVGNAFAHMPPEKASQHAGNYQVSIATQLREVQHGNIDGRDYLTVNIGGHEVGPTACRSNILRMERSGNADQDIQEQIEATAISAMLTRTTVMIVVPLDMQKCIDGKPTFTNLYKLSAGF